ncbi:EcsC family protein [Scopulibacillus darangshiensis]|uniref:EcsC family protein n=1 Tax=Scopulibacillus darangshiensis TaxID=442528 RepID=A0A4R2PAQ0_9BACL|nr:EcsC family protein [Scopulibacillus darangshiensis]TCP32062.1 EcsC family protein [Scopulibacillus darangshiensis]
MALTKAEEEMLERINKWENRFFHYEPTDFSVLYQSWIRRSQDNLSPEWVSKANHTIDRLVFHLQSLIQSTEWMKNGRDKILTEARAIDSGIKDIDDLKQLSVHQLAFIAQKHIGKQRLISSLQGGMTGTGGLFLLTLDVPLSIALQLYAVQLIALTYGYEVMLPGEMMTALKVFHIGLLPKRLKRSAWIEVEKEVIEGEVNPYFYEGQEIMNPSWVGSGIKQIGKTVVISSLKKKMLQGVPILGIAFGAGLNYAQARQVTDIAHHFYQKRCLMERTV